MIRFFNGRLLAINGGFDVTADEVWVDGDKIRYVGPARADAPEFEREIDLGGNLLMPGFKNAHTHSAMTFCRSLADDVPLQPWLFEQIFPLEEHLTPERLYTFTKLAILEYVSGGTTAAFDMYYHRFANAQAGQCYKDFNILAVEMETAGLYWEAMASHKRALSMLSISDHIFTGEGLSAADRQDSFRQMMETALETAWEFAEA